VLPKGGNPQMAMRFIHSVEVRDGTLILKGSAEAFAAHEHDRKNDVFISHAHEENEWVLEIAKRLGKI
jgi:hypothetical protein